MFDNDKGMKLYKADFTPRNNLYSLEGGMIAGSGRSGGRRCPPSSTFIKRSKGKIVSVSGSDSIERSV